MRAAATAALGFPGWKPLETERLPLGLRCPPPLPPSRGLRGSTTGTRGSRGNL